MRGRTVGRVGIWAARSGPKTTCSQPEPASPSVAAGARSRLDARLTSHDIKGFGDRPARTAADAQHVARLHRHGKAAARAATRISRRRRCKLRYPRENDGRRPVSTSERYSGCRLAVKRFALGLAGRRFGDGGAEHPLSSSEVGGPDGVGMLTVMCCCRPRWRAGSYGVRSCQQRHTIRHQARPRVRSARGCSWPRARAAA